MLRYLPIHVWGLAFLSSLSMGLTAQEERTFIGGGSAEGSYLWSDAKNWRNGESIRRGSVIRLEANLDEPNVTHNDLDAVWVPRLIFSKESGPLVIEGKALSLFEMPGMGPARVVNESAYEQKIAVEDIYLYGSPYVRRGWNTVFDSGSAGLQVDSGLLHGAQVEEDEAYFQGVRKQGSGRAVFRGAHDYRGHTLVAEGAWVQAGGVLVERSPHSILELGATGTESASSGWFEVADETKVSFAGLWQRGVLKSGVRVAAGSSVSIHGDLDARDGPLVLVLEGEGEAKGTLSVRSWHANFWQQTLVEDSGEIGFAQLGEADEEGNRLVSRVNLDEVPLLGASGVPAVSHYRALGESGLEQGRLHLDSLTIEGAGSFQQGTGHQGEWAAMGPVLVLPEAEGTYTVLRQWHPMSYLVVLHQLSENAILEIAGRIVIDSGVNASHVRFFKNGPGRVIYSAKEGSVHSAQTHISEGELQVNGGGFPGTQQVWVRQGGLLSGNGVIGGGLVWHTNEPMEDLPENYRYTELHVQAGGMLDGTPSEREEDDVRALQVTGRLNLYPKSNYRVRLSDDHIEAVPLSVLGNANGAARVEIAGNLQLLLNGTPQPGDRVLLATDGEDGSGIHGRFVSVNGVVLAEGENEFTLRSATDEMVYRYRILYQPSAVVVRLLANETLEEVYPEPEELVVVEEEG